MGSLSPLILSPGTLITIDKIYVWDGASGDSPGNGVMASKVHTRLCEIKVNANLSASQTEVVLRSRGDVRVSKASRTNAVEMTS